MREPIRSRTTPAPTVWRFAPAPNERASSRPLASARTATVFVPPPSIPITTTVPSAIVFPVCMDSSPRPKCNVEPIYVRRHGNKICSGAWRGSVWVKQP